LEFGIVPCGLPTLQAARAGVFTGGNVHVRVTHSSGVASGLWNFPVRERSRAGYPLFRHSFKQSTYSSGVGSGLWNFRPRAGSPLFRQSIRESTHSSGVALSTILPGYGSCSASIVPWSHRGHRSGIHISRRCDVLTVNPRSHGGLMAPT